jgi:hypothetical protein
MYGPTFGSGHDVHIKGSMKQGTCRLGSTFKGTAANSVRTCGATSFDIDKMEIWYMSAPPVPPPLAAQGPAGVFADEQRDVGGDGSTMQQSTIATSDEIAAVTFAAGLKPTPGMWARCYSYVVDASTPAAFHSQCDGKGPTLTLGKVAAYGRRFAAYAPKSWMSVNNYVNGVSGAMLYSLDTERRAFATLSMQRGMYDNSGYFPTFGTGHDLYISAAGAVTCRLNNAFSTTSYSLNNFELCGNNQKLEEMEAWPHTRPLSIATYKVNLSTFFVG